MILIFFEKNPIFSGKIGVATTVAPKGLGPQDPTKKLAEWVDLLGQPLSLKHVFKIFGPKPPLKVFFTVLLIHTDLSYFN